MECPVIDTCEYDTPLYTDTVGNGRHNSIVTGVTNKLLVPNGLVLLKRTVQCWLDGWRNRKI
jgi:hypothetical protein